MITLVCGFGRCGSSLIMQMLAAGGMPMTGQPTMYEDARASHTRLDPEWIRAQEGKAVKFLTPHVDTLLPADYRIIWLDRDIKAQAKSHARFMRTMGGVANRKATEHNIKANRKKAIRYCQSLGEVQFFRFEDILQDPEGNAERLAAYCGVEPAPEVVLSGPSVSGSPDDSGSG